MRDSLTEPELRGLERLQDTVHELALAHREPPLPNLLDWAGVGDKELAHSQVLAHLLDPQGDHGQGSRFLDGFLALLTARGARHLSGVRCTRPAITEVYTEYQIDNNRRIDIVVFLPPWGVIAIENKVWAGEQSMQVSDYAAWAEKQLGQDVVVFLTPAGRQPETAGNAAEVVTISFDDLSGWLRTAGWETPAEVRWIIDQYVAQCDRIHATAIGGLGLAAQVPEDVRRRLFSDADRLISTVQLAEWLDRFHSDLRMEFWNSLAQAVSTELDIGGHSANGWVVDKDPDLAPQWSGLSIVNGEPLKRNDQSKPYKTGQYAVRIQQESGRLYLGIARGREVSADDRTAEDRALSKSMGSDFKISDWWTGWRWVGQRCEHILARDRTNLPALFEQVHGAERHDQHQLAKALVELVGNHGDKIIHLQSSIQT